MLRSASHLISYQLQATDGDMGSVKDFLFDDRSWVLRYLVADTRRWLPGRRVLIIPSALGRPDWDRGVVPVKLSRQQIEDCPGIGEDEPVSRRHEEQMHLHYGWPPYWRVPPSIPVPANSLAGASESLALDVGTSSADGDPHLRSISEVTGYRIEATDGNIGQIDEFIVDDDDWSLAYLVIDTRTWLSGRKVLISSRWVGAVDWARQKVSVDLTRERIKQSPEYDPSQPVNRRYEERLYDFYGRPKYWV